MNRTDERPIIRVQAWRPAPAPQSDVTEIVYLPRAEAEAIFGVGPEPVAGAPSRG